RRRPPRAGARRGRWTPDRPLPRRALARSRGGVAERRTGTGARRPSSRRGYTPVSLLVGCRPKGVGSSHALFCERRRFSMAESPVVQRVRELVLPIVADLGLDLYDVEQRGGTLRITVDTLPGSPAGIELDQLALATRLISREL